MLEQVVTYRILFPSIQLLLWFELSLCHLPQEQGQFLLAMLQVERNRYIYHAASVRGNIEPFSACDTD